MTLCQYEDEEGQCGKMVEGRTEYCATHGRLIRKREEDARKEQDKRKAVKKIRPVSDKRKKDNLLYKKRRLKHLDKYPECQLKLEGCTRIATQIHHVNGRIGSNLTNQKHFKSTCAECHRLLHDKISAKEARELGLKI